MRKARQEQREHAMCVTYFMTLRIRNVLNRQSRRHKADAAEAGRGGGGGGTVPGSGILFSGDGMFWGGESGW